MRTFSTSAKKIWMSDLVDKLELVIIVLLPTYQVTKFETDLDKGFCICRQGDVLLLPTNINLLASTYKNKGMWYRIVKRNR